MIRLLALALLALLAGPSASAQYVPELVVSGLGPVPVDNPTVYDGRLFFTRRVEGNAVDELWAYSSATGEAARVASGDAVGKLPGLFTVYDGRLFFVARASLTGNYQIRAYDAARDVVEVAVTNLSEPARWLTVYRDRLYFAPSSGAASIRAYSAATNTTVNAYPFSLPLRSPTGLTVYDDRLFFSAGNGADPSGNELWVFDADGGTVALVADLNPGTASSVPSDLTVIGGRLLFGASTPGVSGALHAYDAATNAITPLTAPGQPPVNVREPTGFDGDVVFQGTDAVAGAEVWRFRPATGTATRVTDVAATGSSQAAGFVGFDGRLFFSATDGATGAELWVSDGVGTATRVADLFPGPQDGVVFGGQLQQGRKTLVAYGDRLFFSGTNGAPGGGGLWAVRARGTAAEPGAAVAGLSLRASPNPIGASATVSVTLDVDGDLRVEVFDALGRRVAVLHDGPLDAGPHAFRFDAASLAPGVYVVRVAGGDAVRAQRLTVVR